MLGKCARFGGCNLNCVHGCRWAYAQEGALRMDCQDESGASAGAGVMPLLPTGAAERKNTPMARGLLDYFPLACAAVAELSRIGNEQHNPGQPMHWAREKSTDHADCIVRHLIDRGKLDTDGVRHATKIAWRALALLQLEIESA